MNNKLVVTLMFSILIIVSGILGFLILQYNTAPAEVATVSKPAEEPPVQKVTSYRAQLDYIEGQVEKKASEESGWLTAENGDVFTSGMGVRTLADSKAIVTFEDGSIARLDENTQIKIATGENSIALDMSRGTVFNKVSKNESRQYIVSSGNYSMRALGTVFSVSNEDGTNPELLVLESQVEMKKGNDTSIEVALAGEKIAIADNKFEKKKISKKDIEKKFVSWNISKDKMDIKLNEDEKITASNEKISKKTTTPTDTQKDITPENNSKITLAGKSSDSGIRLTWQTEHLGSFDGFKVVKSKDSNPVYPGDTYQYFSGSETKAYTWNITDGEKYHFRVCRYAGGKCTLYSNDVYERAPEKSSGSSKSDENYATDVSLNGAKDGTTAKFTWSISGGSSPLGFKVVKSKDKNPVYPGNDYQYLSNSDTRSYNWSGFSTGDTYHFRVCVYKGGSCGAYSNDVEITF